MHASGRRTPSAVTALIDAIERLAGAGSADDIVGIVRSTARRLIGSDGIAVILRTNELCHYVEEDAMGPLWKGQKFPLTSCVSGWAMLHKQTVVIPDIALDDRVPQDLYRQTFVRSMMMAPVRSDDPIGAIGAYWAEVYDPSPEEIDTLETLARAAATAMENVRLIDALSRALADAETARDELRHRVKNAFTAASALAQLTLPQDHARALGARLAALARAHELIDQKLARQSSIALADLIAAELEPYSVDAEDRFTVVGEDVVLPSAVAVALGLAINELATNALKYGALSTGRGRLRVAWRRENDHLVLEWIETDGPATRTAALEGFGSRLLRRLVEGQLRGALRRELASGGATCVIEFPLDPALASVTT